MSVIFNFPRRRRNGTRIDLFARKRVAEVIHLDPPRATALDIAAHIPAQAMESAIDLGKHVHLEVAGDALIFNVTAIDALRGRGACQRCTSTNRVANVRQRDVREAMLLCCNCRDVLGVLGVVDGGDVA